AGFPQAGPGFGDDPLGARWKVARQGGPPHFFFWGGPHCLQQLGSRLDPGHPGPLVRGYWSAPVPVVRAGEDAAAVGALHEARPDFVWVGLGMPKQEKWMASHVGRINAAALIGVGAAFDFHAGTTPRAPLWMQRSGVEWLFRLITEPRRLAPRYSLIISMFLVRAAQQLSGWKSYAQEW